MLRVRISGKAPRCEADGNWHTSHPQKLGLPSSNLGLRTTCSAGSCKSVQLRVLEARPLSVRVRRGAPSDSGAIGRRPRLKSDEPARDGGSNPACPTRSFRPSSNRIRHPPSKRVHGDSSSSGRTSDTGDVAQRKSVRLITEGSLDRCQPSPPVHRPLSSVGQSSCLVSSGSPVRIVAEGTNDNRAIAKRPGCSLQN